MFLRQILFVLGVSINSLTFAVNLELTQGINAAIPIGINAFGTDHYSNAITDVIANDLDLTGQFRRLSSGMQTQSLSYWQRVGVDNVLSGSVIAMGGMLEVRYELSDALAQGHILLSKKYQIQATQSRALAHHISDEIYAKLTGARGIFSTHIAYVLVRRSASSTQYSLEIADMDSSNPRSLLVSSEPIMSPTWSPDGRQIAYVSFEKKRAQIFSVQVATGQRRLLTDFSGINGAPAWSPDGRNMVVVLSKTGSPKLYQVNLSNGIMKQLTFGDAIDTEPRYAPDGQSLLFTSGRGGNPQIYRLSLRDGQITRLTFQGNYNARASYTPNQQQIVMLHREDQQFNIGVQTLGQAGIMPLTNSPMDESPSVAPNGRFVLYATRYQDRGILSLTSIDGRTLHRFPARDGDIQEPAWSPLG